MTSLELNGTRLNRIREYVWEIEPEGGMRVPGRVFASEQLLQEIADDKTLQQLKNTAHLPGITNYAICMPDGHQGYGFPVGGVAALDTEDGAISPGGVGFDINCLSGDAEVLLSHGRRRRIDSLARDFEDEQVVVPAAESTQASMPLYTESSSQEVVRVKTSTGDTVEATPDHEFETPAGMIELAELDTGDAVYIRPFEGFEDEQPPAFTVLTEADFTDQDQQLVSALRERDLLPLKSTDEEFNYLLKLVGFHTGDGSFNGSQSWFYGDPEDLETIQEDIRALGFTPSNIYEGDRTHESRDNKCESTAYGVRSTSNAFKQLLINLGAPTGQNVDSAFTAPAYLTQVPAWQQALYLSAFFGAEMGAPAPMSAKNLDCPSVSHDRRSDCRESGVRFMQDLMELLNRMGIATNQLEEVGRGETTDAVRFRFGIDDDSRNLIRFFTKVGYRYNRSKQRAAVLAATYLKRKEREIEQRSRIASEARAMADGGVAVREIKSSFDQVNGRFVERSVLEQRDGQPRPGADFPDFETFAEEHEVRPNMTVAVDIEEIEALGEKRVYDIGVSHAAHRFLAEGFVVSNCGVRMLRSNLTYEDVKGREEELVNRLFEAIPSGLGGGGVVEADVGTIDEILARGVDWAVEHGYAVQEDTTHCEDEGRRPDATPEHVPEKAKERGKSQIGSLGSGNHFLEVQRVTDIFRPAVADAFGLAEDQIVVLIHCGSRGLGHQVCTDYVREIEEEHADLVDQLPDKELAAAPAGSRLAEEYYGAMCACINFAWVNRQLVMHQTRQVFEEVFDRDWQAMEMELLYDVAHNIAKKEVHDVPLDPPAPAGEDVPTEERELYVHRKGSTRAFPAGHPEVPTAYREVGQPVIIPGNMGAGSYVLRGGEASMTQTFGSTAHGAGRLMSRTQAKQEFWGGDVQDDLREQQSVYVKAQSGATIAEEAPGVYKDVDEVVRVSDALGIGDKVARTFPVCNIKG